MDQEPGGYVLKRRSPSCGLERVKLYSGYGLLNDEGRGLFTSGLPDRFPIWHYICKLNVEYLREQVYLEYAPRRAEPIEPTLTDQKA